jgi:hypothetical protein
MKRKHEKHYGGEDNPHEAIKVIEYYGLGFHLGNAIKYILRSGKKHPTTKGTIDDLRKAIWYLERQALLLGKKGNRKSRKGKK